MTGKIFFDQILPIRQFVHFFTSSLELLCFLFSQISLYVSNKLCFASETKLEINLRL